MIILSIAGTFQANSIRFLYGIKDK